MPRLSIVLAPSKEIKQLEDTLVSVLENRPADCQVLVVLNDLYTDPYHLEDEVTFIHAPRGADMPTCLNLGVAAATAPVVHVLACGTEVSPGWTRLAMRHFRDRTIAAVAPLLLDRDDPHCVVAAGVDYRAGGRTRLARHGNPLDSVPHELQDILGPTLAAAFYRKVAIEAVGGFSAAMGDGMAGVDIALSLESAGWRSVLEPMCRAYASSASLPTTSRFRQALSAERLFWRWARRAGWTQSLAAHAWVLATEGLRDLANPIRLLATIPGRLLGACSMGSHSAHHERLDELREQIRIPAPSGGPKPHFALPSSHAKPARRQVA